MRKINTRCSKKTTKLVKIYCGCGIEEMPQEDWNNRLTNECSGCNGPSFEVDEKSGLLTFECPWCCYPNYITKEEVNSDNYIRCDDCLGGVPRIVNGPNYIY